MRARRKSGPNSKPTTRLSKQDVLEIRYILRCNDLFKHDPNLALRYGVTRRVSRREIAAMYGTVQPEISYIKNRAIWKRIRLTRRETLNVYASFGT